ncbi:type II secretion system F family protein [Photobacterium sp. TY1-4]|uniref:type II secretion system F family protein n=1 Tax=Photobacterium sp. TY1-4 TaxID=2899122 RepID=UPI0021BEADC9|nr:type II secretion system F family protein [Photobacterium sp. TY1-4]UXI01657.1 type II secretion system F family protein [Photobacterium sp. TY1-4]
MSQSTKIRHYHWRGVNQKGKKVSGITLGFQEQDVRKILNDQLIQVKKIKRCKPSALSQLKNQLKPADITAITRQLATMTNSGVPVVQGLNMMASSHHKSEARAVLTQVTAQVEAGASLSRAMQTSSPLFDKFYCDLVATGEQTGHLGDVFGRIATYREKSEAMRKKVIKAMIYPAMVTFTAIGVTILMLVMVIPQFAQIFAGFGAELPWFTRQVLHASDVMITHGPIMAAALVLISLITSYQYKRVISFRRKVHQLLLRLPLLGEITLKATVARFARTLATTFSAGIPLLSGLQSAGKTADNLYIEQAVAEVHAATAAGMPLHIALRQSGVFPELMLQMTQIGEESGSLDDMLNKMALLFEDEVENIVDNLGKIIEPVIILFLGGLVASLLFAMYMPIIKLMSVIG